MFLSRKNQYCENDYPTKCNLQIQCDPYQITMAFFTELEQKISQFIWKHKRPQVAKAVLRKKNGAGGIPFLTQTTLQKATMIKTVWHWLKDKYGPMEQDRKPRNKPMHLWVLYF